MEVELAYIHAEQRQETDLVQLKLRFQERVRARLEDAAKANGTSLNSEIVGRLDRSLDDDALAGNQETSRFLIALASQITIAERDTGKSWQEDAETYWLARLLMNRTIASYDPVSEENRTYVELRQQIDEAKQRRDLLDGVLTDCRAIGRNALLMLATSKEDADYVELSEKFWINPTSPDTPMTESDRETVQNWLTELREVRQRIDMLRIEITNLRAPISVAKDRALAAFERLTAPAEV